MWCNNRLGKRREKNTPLHNYWKGEFKTTSRSPIYISDENNYPIKEKHSFNDGDVKYFFYDKSFIEKYYDVVILFTETDLNIKLCENQVTYKL